MIEIPLGIVDQKSYQEWLTLSKEVFESEDRFYQTSIVDLKVDLLTPMMVMRRLVKDLPEDEKEKIYEIAMDRRRLMGKCSVLKRKAWKGKEYREDLKGMNALLTPRKSEILELFGKFYNATEVHKIVNKDWGYAVSFQSILQFQMQNIEYITELQESYKKTYSSVRLSHKRSRLEELTTLYRHRRDIYEEIRGKEDYRLLLMTLEQIRKEVEGNTLSIDLKADMKLESILSIHTNELLGGLILNNLIVARVAAKTNISTQWLMNVLNRSFYAKFTGFQAPDKGLMEDEVIYPSNVVYNFDEIKKNNVKLIEEHRREQVVPIEEKPGEKTSEEELNKTYIAEYEGEEVEEDIRKKLLRLIKGKNVEMAQMNDRMSRIEEKPALKKDGKRRTGVRGKTDRKDVVSEKKKKKK